jgi:hypothetical protein
VNRNASMELMAYHAVRNVTVTGIIRMAVTMSLESVSVKKNGMVFAVIAIVIVVIGDQSVPMHVTVKIIHPVTLRLDLVFAKEAGLGRIVTKFVLLVTLATTVQKNVPSA